MRFFFDRCAPIGIARMVRALENQHTIVHLDEDTRFNKETKDIEWLTTLGKDNDPLWIVISGDGRILKNRAEKQVLQEVGLPFFCLHKKWQSTEIYEYAWRFMKVWPKILKAAEPQKKNMIFTVNAGSSLLVERMA